MKFSVDFANQIIEKQTIKRKKIQMVRGVTRMGKCIPTLAYWGTGNDRCRRGEANQVCHEE